jgi:hypothetical protein
MMLVYIRQQNYALLHVDAGSRTAMLCTNTTYTVCAQTLQALGEQHTVCTALFKFAPQ